jgi:hypothetical protein
VKLPKIRSQICFLTSRSSICQLENQNGGKLQKLLLHDWRKSRVFVFNLLSVRGEDLKMCFLQRRLGNAAKKALSKIPTKNIKSEDKVSYFVW